MLTASLLEAVLRGWRVLGILALAGLVLSTPVVAQGDLTAEAVKSQVAERFGVEVLRIVEAEEDGRPVYIVTVMNPAGDYNAAFQVTRLMIDRSTGELVSQFRHGASGYVLPGGGGGADADGRAIRRMTIQESQRQ